MASDSVTEGEGVSLPPPVVENLLSTERRRLALAILSERGEPVALTDLSRAIRARQAGVSADEVPTEACRDIRDRLFQVDLPKLTATDVVAYDSAMGTVDLVATALGERAAREE